MLVRQGGGARLSQEWAVGPGAGADLPDLLGRGPHSTGPTKCCPARGVLAGRAAYTHLHGTCIMPGLETHQGQGPAPGLCNKTTAGSGAQGKEGLLLGVSELQAG